MCIHTTQGDSVMVLQRFYSIHIQNSVKRKLLKFF